LSDEAALALVLAGLKGEEPLAELCRRYGVSATTYYKLRDRFLAAGAEGISHGGHTREVKSLRDRIDELERAVDQMSLQIELRTGRPLPGVGPKELRTAAAEFVRRGLSWTAVAETLGVPRSRLYERRRPRKAKAGRDREAFDAAVLRIIREELAREPRYGRFGYRRWRAVLRQRGLVINHKRLRRILGQAGLSQKRIRRSYRRREPWVRRRPAGLIRCGRWT